MSLPGFFINLWVGVVLGAVGACVQANPLSGNAWKSHPPSRSTPSVNLYGGRFKNPLPQPRLKLKTSTNKGRLAAGALGQGSSGGPISASNQKRNASGGAVQNGGSSSRAGGVTATKAGAKQSASDSPGATGADTDANEGTDDDVTDDDAEGEESKKALRDYNFTQAIEAAHTAAARASRKSQWAIKRMVSAARPPAPSGGGASPGGDEAGTIPKEGEASSLEEDNVDDPPTYASMDDPSPEGEEPPAPAKAYEAQNTLQKRKALSPKIPPPSTPEEELEAYSQTVNASKATGAYDDRTGGDAGARAEAARKREAALRARSQATVASRYGASPPPEDVYEEPAAPNAATQKRNYQRQTARHQYETAPPGGQSSQSRRQREAYAKAQRASDAQEEERAIRAGLAPGGESASSMGGEGDSAVARKEAGGEASAKKGAAAKEKGTNTAGGASSTSGRGGATSGKGADTKQEAAGKKTHKSGPASSGGESASSTGSEGDSAVARKEAGSKARSGAKGRAPSTSSDGKLVSPTAKEKGDSTASGADSRSAGAKKKGDAGPSGGASSSSGRGGATSGKGADTKQGAPGKKTHKSGSASGGELASSTGGEVSAKNGEKTSGSLNEKGKKNKPNRANKSSMPPPGESQSGGEEGGVQDAPQKKGRDEGREAPGGTQAMIDESTDAPESDEDEAEDENSAALNAASDKALSEGADDVPHEDEMTSEKAFDRADAPESEEDEAEDENSDPRKETQEATDSGDAASDPKPHASSKKSEAPRHTQSAGNKNPNIFSQLGDLAASVKPAFSQHNTLANPSIPQEDEADNNEANLEGSEEEAGSEESGDSRGSGDEGAPHDAPHKAFDRADALGGPQAVIDESTDAPGDEDEAEDENSAALNGDAGDAPHDEMTSEKTFDRADEAEDENAQGQPSLNLLEAMGSQKRKHSPSLWERVQGTIQSAKAGGPDSEPPSFDDEADDA